MICAATVRIIVAMQKHSLLVLHLLLAFIVVHEGLSFRGAERDNGNGR